MEHPLRWEDDGVRAVYREYIPCEALRGSVRALFSFSEAADARVDRLVSMEARLGADERVCAPTFADGHVCIVISFAREYGPDRVWRSEASAISAEVIGPVTTAGPATVVPVRRESVGAYLRAGAALPGVPACELEGRIVDLECVWGLRRRGFART